MKRSSLGILVLAAALIQAYFVSAATSGRFGINLVLVVLLYVVMERSVRLSLLLAAWGGLWLDLAAGQFGPRILILVLLVIMLRWLSQLGLEMSRRFTQITLVFMLAYLYSIGLLLLNWVSLQQLSWRFSLLGWWSIEALLSAVVAWLISRRMQAAIKI